MRLVRWWGPGHEGSSGCKGLYTKTIENYRKALIMNRCDFFFLIALNFGWRMDWVGTKNGNGRPL